MERVSVLMPAFNAGSYIREAIDSVLGQSFPSWELVIVNDGSSDDTEQIIFSYSDDRIHYYKNESNKGLVYTRNRLLSLANYDLIAFLDSDDIATKERLEIQVNYLLKHPAIGLVGASLFAMDDKKMDKKSFVFDLSAAQLPAHLLFYNPVSTSSVMFRKNILPLEKFREGYPPAEDYDLWARMLNNNKGVVLNSILGYYRLHASSISKKLSTASYDNRNKVVLDQLEYYFPGSYSPDEKELHLSLADLTLKTRRCDVQQIIGWMEKLLALNASDRKLDQAELKQILFERLLKKMLRLESYDWPVYERLLNLKRSYHPRMNMELWAKMMVIGGRCILKKSS